MLSLFCESEPHTVHESRVKEQNTSSNERHTEAPTPKLQAALDNPPPPVEEAQQSIETELTVPNDVLRKYISVRHKLVGSFVRRKFLVRSRTQNGTAPEAERGERGAGSGERSEESLHSLSIVLQVLIPLALISYALICLTLLAHLPPSRSYPVERALIENIVEPGSSKAVTPIKFASVDSPEDFFDWLRDTVVPMVTARRDYNHDMTGYAYDAQERKANLGWESKRLLHYNRLICAF